MYCFGKRLHCGCGIALCAFVSLVICSCVSEKYALIGVSPCGDAMVLYCVDGARNSLQLEAEAMSDDDLVLRWESSDEGVATVLSNGLVKSAGAGRAEIRAIAYDSAGKIVARSKPVQVSVAARIGSDTKTGKMLSEFLSDAKRRELLGKDVS